MSYAAVLVELVQVPGVSVTDSELSQPDQQDVGRFSFVAIPVKFPREVHRVIPSARVAVGCVTHVEGVVRKASTRKTTVPCPSRRAPYPVRYILQGITIRKVA